jgi:hypothetical protein
MTVKAQETENGIRSATIKRRTSKSQQAREMVAKKNDKLRNAMSEDEKIEKGSKWERHQKQTYRDCL